ncbi:HNH endonuclease [Rossellomorea vietnamensis]|uniref:HNH endonuclease n=1 Tax=Rossellomorea vietnamensis TaxID=218284 RepID=UPI00077C5279|nr:HNH endonuclease [Rossellomorea vietnamensis]
MISIKNKDLDSIAHKHYEAVKEHLDKEYRGINYYNEIDNWFKKSHFNISFKTVLLADVPTMRKIKNKYKQKKYPDFIEKLVRVYKNNFSPKDSYLGSNHYNSLELAKTLGVNTCPYCNRNYINSITYGSKGHRRTCQFDHFFPKDKYPFLALSFYNLIPACYSCNHIKHNNGISVSPYENGVENMIKFEYKLKAAQGIFDPEFLEINLKSLDKRIERNIDVLRLNDKYSFHTKDAQDILLKAIMFNDSQIDEYIDKYGNLFNKNEMIDLIYGTDLNTGNYLVKPISKLRTDIFSQRSW